MQEIMLLLHLLRLEMSTLGLEEPNTLQRIGPTHRQCGKQETKQNLTLQPALYAISWPLRSGLWDVAIKYELADKHFRETIM